MARKRNETHEEQVDRLLAHIEMILAQKRALKAQVAKLETIVNMHVYYYRCVGVKEVPERSRAAWNGRRFV